MSHEEYYRSFLVLSRNDQVERSQLADRSPSSVNKAVLDASVLLTDPESGFFGSSIQSAAPLTRFHFPGMEKEVSICFERRHEMKTLCPTGVYNAGA